MPALEIRQWRLARRVAEALEENHFELATRKLDLRLGEGEVLMATRYISLDPYLLLQMQAQAPGPCNGRVIGEVLQSRDPRFIQGMVAWGVGAWQDHVIIAGDALAAIPDDGLPPTLALGALGRSGLTAWVGLHLAAIKPGETVIVSSATGPVGSVVGQLARLRGGRAVGIAGGAEKCRLALKAFGYDACIDHLEPELEGRIAEAIPRGAEILFENVGAPTLDPALPSLREHARITLCGLVAHYNDSTPVTLRNFRRLLLSHITLRGFATTDHPELFAEGEAELRGLARAGRLAWHETIVDGFEQVPAAFIAMLAGSGTGKRLVRV